MPLLHYRSALSCGLGVLLIWCRSAVSCGAGVLLQVGSLMWEEGQKLGETLRGIKVTRLHSPKGKGY